ncbi:hypothetical protein E2I00_000705, partial [Balaenoptera physalus]
MEGVAGNAPCEHFEANVLAQRCCQNCFHPEEAHRARHQGCGQAVASAPVLGSKVPREPVPRPPPGPALRGPSAGLPAEGLTATPRSQEPEAAPYLEGLASSLCGSFNESPDSGTSSSPDCEAPDDTSDSSSVVRGGREARARAGVCPSWASPGVPRKPPDGAEPLTTGNRAEVLWSLSQHDWDTVERQEEAPSGDKFTVMIPRKPQEGPRADSARRAPPLLTRSPVGGDTAGQRKEGEYLLPGQVGPCDHRLWWWEPKRRTALGEAPGRKRVLLLGAAPVGADPGPSHDTTEQSSKCHPPGFLSPSLCPKGRCPDCFHTTRYLPSLLSPPNCPTGQPQNLVHPTGHPQDLFHATEHPQIILSLKSRPTGHPQNLVHPTGHPQDLFHATEHPQIILSLKSRPAGQPQNLVHPAGHPQDLFHAAEHPQIILSLKSCPTGQPQNLVHPTEHPQDLFHATEHPQIILSLKSCPTRHPQNLGDGPRTSSPSRSKQSEVPWASIALRPTQSDRPQTSSPIRPAQQTSDAEDQSPQHEPPQFPPPVCIGYRDAPRASSPPRQAPEPSLLHNLEREEYTVLADLPPPRRLAQREPGPQCSNGGRTRSPGRAEVERLFGQERRKSEAPGAFQTQDEGRSRQPSQVQSQPLRRQSSPALSREVTKPLAKQAEPARRSRAEPPHPRSPERRPEGERRLQGSSPPPRTSARTPEREQRTERPLQSGRAGPRQPLGGWRRLGGPSRGAARALEETWRGPPRESEESWKLLGGPPCHRGQSEAWEEPPRGGPREPPDRPAQRGWGSLQELSSPHQPLRPPENSRAGPGEVSKPRRPETPPAMGWGAEGACPHLHGPERQAEPDWRDLVGLLGAPREGAWTHSEEPTLASALPRLDWEGLLELLQAQLPRRDSAGHWGGPGTISPGTTGTLELEPERHTQSEGGAGATLVNGYSPGQWPQSSAQPPSPAGISTQWPKTKVTSGPETSTMAGLEETGQLRGRSPAEGPSSLQWETLLVLVFLCKTGPTTSLTGTTGAMRRLLPIHPNPPHLHNVQPSTASPTDDRGGLMFQSKEPEESEGSRGQDSLTDQKQADSVVGS